MSVSLGDAIFWIIIFLYFLGMAVIILWYDNRTAKGRGTYRLIYVIRLNPDTLMNRYQPYIHGPKSRKYSDLPMLPAEWDVSHEDCIPGIKWKPLSRNDRLPKKIWRMLRRPRTGFIIFRDGADVALSHYNCYKSDYNDLTPDYLKRKIESHVAENFIKSLKATEKSVGGVKWYLVALVVAVVVVVGLRMMGVI